MKIPDHITRIISTAHKHNNQWLVYGTVNGREQIVFSDNNIFKVMRFAAENGWYNNV